MSAHDFLKTLAYALAKQGIETWLGMNEERPMEQSEQAYLLYEISLYLQEMNTDAVQRLIDIPI